MHHWPILLTLLVLRPGTSLGFEPTPNELKGKYNLVWSDEFDSDDVAADVWYWRTDIKHRSVQLRDRVAIKEGSLVLTLGPLDEPIDRKRVAGGGIVSRRRFHYGYAEVRAKLGDGRDDDDDGQVDEGWHHAFWAMAAIGDELGNVDTTYPSERRTEIDCYEYATERPHLTQHVIIWEPYGKEAGRRPKRPTDRFTLPEGFKPYEWHTYGYEWSAEQCRFYIDGQLTKVGNYPADEYEHDELNLWLTAISANWNVKGAEKSVAEYDYVRFFEVNRTD